MKEKKKIAKQKTKGMYKIELDTLYKIHAGQRLDEVSHIPLPWSKQKNTAV